jgi:membrane-bound lytic murein transglycosylase MltF
MTVSTLRLLIAILLVPLAVACASPDPESAAGGAEPSTEASPGEEPMAATADDGAQQSGDAASTDLISRPFTGDFDGMVERRMLRILTPYSRTHYFIDQGQQRGLVYDAGMKLEETINKKQKTSRWKINVVFVPTSRDGLYKSLVDGRGDIIAAGVFVTPKFKELVDFTEPTARGVSQIVVTGPGGPSVASTDDLAGKTLSVRQGSAQHQVVDELNAKLQAAGKPPITVQPLPTALEDEDILEMVNAGLVEATVVNEAIAKFWKQILPDLTIHEDVAVQEEGDIAWAVRKGSPKLLAELNPVIKANREGTLFGNVVLKRYLQNVQYVKRATSEAELKKFRDVVELFRKYGDQYDLDYLLMIAQGYQESRLDHSARSRVGAIGIMQIMPATGKELDVGDIRVLENNVHGGVKYIRFMIDRYFKDEPMDTLNKGLFAFASYNAGPARVRQLRQEAERRGLDPNKWFNNVERVAAERIGREPVQYVSNIYKYYVAYKLAIQQLEEKAQRSQ